MNKALLIFALAGWILLMGMIGFAKTGVIMPFLANGAVALRTSFLGWFTIRGSKLGYIITMIWLPLSSLLYIYFCFNENGIYKVSTTDGYLMFGSMAVFSLMTFVVMLRYNLKKKQAKA